MTKKKRSLKRAIEEGKLLFGMYSRSGCPTMIEILGYCGFDYVIIDTEHGPYGIETAVELVRTAEAAGVAPIIRVAENNPSLIMKALDTGAHGILIPHVDTKEEAIRAVESAKYPPEGTRGTCPSIRLSRYASASDWSKKKIWEIANRETLVAIMPMESKEGVANIEEIISVGNIDMISLGHADISQALGFPGQFDHPIVLETREKVLAICKQKGIAVKVALPNFSELNKWVKKGCHVFDLWNDVATFTQACRRILNNAKRIASNLRKTRSY